MFTALVCLALCQAEKGEKIPPRIVEFLNACDAEKAERLALMNRILDANTSGMKQFGRDTRNPGYQKLKIAVDQMKKQIADLSAPEKLCPPTMPAPPKTGSLGTVDQLGPQIIQVVSKTSLLADCQWIGAVKPHAVMFRGIDTTDMTDGMGTTFPPQTVFECKGTTTYGTVGGGTQTVFVFEPFDMTEVLKWHKLSLPAKTPSKKPVKSSPS